MEAQSQAIEMYQKDVEDLEKLISIALRPNIKRQLEEYKNNLSNLLKEEKKKIGIYKKDNSTEKKEKQKENLKEKNDNETKKISIELEKLIKMIYLISKKKIIIRA